jgi:enoyl-CoA hydratase/carnithine racemase
MELTQTRYEIERGVATVTLYRPEQMNAFTKTMRKELVEIFAAADQDDSVRVVVVTGAGKAFCAGADLSAGGSAFNRTVQEGREVAISEHRDGGGQVALAIFRCRKPVIVENTSAVSVALSKALLWHGLAEGDPQSAHLIDSRCFYWMGHEKDSREGVESFLEKRPPKFAMKVSTDMPDFYPWWKEPKV